MFLYACPVCPLGCFLFLGRGYKAHRQYFKSQVWRLRKGGVLLVSCRTLETLKFHSLQYQHPQLCVMIPCPKLPRFSLVFCWGDRGHVEFKCCSYGLKNQSFHFQSHQDPSFRSTWSLFMVLQGFILFLCRQLVFFCLLQGLAEVTLNPVHECLV